MLSYRNTNGIQSCLEKKQKNVWKLKSKQEHLDVIYENEAVFNGIKGRNLLEAINSSPIR